ncbi:hypothetical protein BHU72_14485 [Desulfuribacillus stibiiarsenatis]|uniref:Conjugative transposon protein TcpC n=1 Tax=Desulfuribacillus stibiiarsenatis TaxID=1390249 RepID=A0A1E5L7D8_9FIRM|nr:hypothetical protein [Desulfuribacillus stibiiarsenatis]OEH86036.1 hypothetical protein BHU72_14485 [Desulfuribacillus stibiiarsenatis]
MRGKEWSQTSRWKIFLNKGIAVLVLIIFGVGILGWLDGWGNNITQEVTQVTKEEADVFSEPSLVNGAVTVLIHKWFDYVDGKELWQDVILNPTIMNYSVDTRYRSRVIASSVDQVIRLSDNTAEVKVMMLREVEIFNENREAETIQKVETVRIPLMYKDGAIQPLSGPIIESRNRSYGLDINHTPIVITEDEDAELKKLVEGFLSSLGNGNKSQIGFFFKDQKLAPNPMVGTIKFVRLIPIAKKGDEIQFVVLARQKEGLGLELNHIYKITAEKSVDRYLIKTFEVGL